MKRRCLHRSRTACFAASIITLTACYSGDTQTSVVVQAPNEPQTDTVNTVVPPGSMDLNEQIEFSRNDLAQRLGVEIDSVILSKAQMVTWSSGALGCPEDGMNYTQALIPGVLIHLDVGGKAHEYHAKHGGKPFHCPQERTEQPLPRRGSNTS